MSRSPVNLSRRTRGGYSTGGATMAGAVSAPLPMLTLFFLAQKRTTGGPAAGAMK